MYFKHTYKRYYTLLYVTLKASDSNCVYSKHYDTCTCYITLTLYTCSKIRLAFIYGYIFLSKYDIDTAPNRQKSLQLSQYVSYCTVNVNVWG